LNLEGGIVVIQKSFRPDIDIDIEPQGFVMDEGSWKGKEGNGGN